MKISRSEYELFKATPHDKALRFGQAWFNHFKLQAHTPADNAERVLLARIYNETDKAKAERFILDNFTDWTN